MSVSARPTGNTSSGPEESGRLADLWRPDGFGICILKLLADSGKCCMFAMEINTFSERLAPRIRLNLNSAFIYFSNRCTVFLFPYRMDVLLYEAAPTLHIMLNIYDVNFIESKIEMLKP